MNERSLENMIEFQRGASGWRFSRVIVFELHFVNFQPLGSGNWIPFPGEIAAKKAVINPRNEEDDFCFKWCLAIAFEPPKTKPQRITRKLIESSKWPNWEGIEFPVILSAIKKFEQNNPGIAVSVFGFERNVYPLRISKVQGFPVDLLADWKRRKATLLLDKRPESIAFFPGESS